MKKLSRRQVIKAGLSGAALVAAGCAINPKKEARSISSSSLDVSEDNKFEFIVIGSGAGGGPLAGRLAQAGFSVLLLEAGGKDPGQFSPIPATHGRAADDPLINWNFFVKRYTDVNQDRRNSKYDKAGNGIYYPRASVLGGCTAVNAMIHLYPDNEDWDYIEKITGDSSWNHNEMYEHFERIRSAKIVNSTGNDIEARNEILGNYRKGWLTLTQASIGLILNDEVLLKFVLGALKKEGILDELNDKFIDRNFKLDPNTRKYIENKYNGLYNIPINSVAGKRNGVAEFLLGVQSVRKDKLKIYYECLCKQLIFDDQSTKAKVIGVEFARGGHIYKASGDSKSSYTLDKAFATKEVIVAGGAFNSPQILMLSGIGREEELKPMGIQPRANVRGVGLNLQDRYEVTVVSKLWAPIKTAKGCTFAINTDPCLDKWIENPNTHLYGTNGVAVSYITRSSDIVRSDISPKASPDLSIFGLPGMFQGYIRNWSNTAYDPDYFTWAILKGHTHNKDGYVRLKNADFRETPDINFRYFNQNSPESEDDLMSVVSGINQARAINKNIKKGTIFGEVYPGPKYQKDEELKQWVKDESWGHHASCSNRIGDFKKDEYAVVDSKFRVRDVDGLRVVDASVFPKIPGLFIVVPTLVISEKAAQLIIDQYKGTGREA